MRHVVALYIRL